MDGQYDFRTAFVPIAVEEPAPSHPRPADRAEPRERNGHDRIHISDRAPMRATSTTFGDGSSGLSREETRREPLPAVLPLGAVPSS
jgi:hypothetical protein